VWYKSTGERFALEFRVSSSREILADSEGVALSDAPRLALSVPQPRAGLILTGHKKIELRTWTTDHRGPLWSNIL
jgi:hypothetical protein